MYILTDTLGQLITTPDEPVLLGLNGEPIDHECRSGEGPPEALPDPEGKGLHPKIQRGTSELRSRNPSVGYAQNLLNRFLAKVNDQTISCDVQTEAIQKKLAAGLIELKAIRQWPLKVDCRFGSGTEIATKMFQACKGLEEDGVIGYKTWEKLVQYKRDDSSKAPPNKLDRLEDRLAVAKSSAEICGVYWSARSLDFGIPGPIANHHFITFIYNGKDHAVKILSEFNKKGFYLKAETPEGSKIKSSEFKVNSIRNRVGTTIYLSTIGFTTPTGSFPPGPFLGPLFPFFAPEADLKALWESANSKKSEKIIWGFQGRHAFPSASNRQIKDDDFLMLEIGFLVSNFIKNYHNRVQGHPYLFYFLKTNCAAAVNTIFYLLGYREEVRRKLGNFKGNDPGANITVPGKLFLAPKTS